MPVELLWIAGVAALVALSRRPTRLGRFLQLVGRLLMWAGIGLAG